LVMRRELCSKKVLQYHTVLYEFKMSQKPNKSVPWGCLEAPRQGRSSLDDTDHWVNHEEICLVAPGGILYQEVRYQVLEHHLSLVRMDRLEVKPVNMYRTECFYGSWYDVVKNESSDVEIFSIRVFLLERAHLFEQRTLSNVETRI
jgi:hypothetical protein